MFVLFEGLDLSGKSTLCRELASVLNWPVRNNSLLPKGQDHLHQTARAAHAGQTGSISEVGHLFLNALRDEINRYQGEGEPCIQDSTLLLRSTAYHTVLGNHDLAAAFAALSAHHPRPALAFLCRPSLQVRLRRLEGRISRGNDTSEDHLVRDDPETFARMEHLIEELAAREFGMEVIDTSNLEDLEARQRLIEQLAGRIRSLIS